MTIMLIFRSTRYCAFEEVVKGAAVKTSTLDRFKAKLITMRRRLAGDVDQIKTNALKPRDAASGDVSIMPIHMADIASDNYDKEFALGLIQSEQKEVRDIDEAIERIENGTFGQCELCGGRVGYGRLTALPYARLCIDCKRTEEENGA